MRATSPARAPSPSELARQSDGGANVLAFTRTSRVPARMVLVLLGNDNRVQQLEMRAGRLRGRGKVVSAVIERADCELDGVLVVEATRTGPPRQGRSTM
jgi:hypothetical protein